MDSETDAQKIERLEAENLRLRQAANDTGQLSRDDLKGMDPRDISQAHKDGRLRDITEAGK